MKRTEIQEIIVNSSSRKIGAAMLRSTENLFKLDFLDPHELRVEFYEGEIEPNLLIEGIWNLTQLPSSYKQEVLEQIFQSYVAYLEELGCSSAEQAIKEQELEEHIPPKCKDDISNLVSFFSITGGIRRSDGCTILSIRGSTAWDSEHGIVLFFENGKNLVKIGSLNDGYD